MSSGKGWYGVDLDGTLAEYFNWQGPEHIGPPISRMLERVKTWMDEGKEVRIFTARIWSPPNDPIHQRDAAKAVIAIQDWCVRHLGRMLPITNVKDFDMVEVWDDRAIRVVKNTGEIDVMS